MTNSNCRKTNELKTFHISKELKMNLFDPNNNLQNFTRIFSQFVLNMVYFLIWATIGLASLAATYVAVRALLVAVGYTLRALGI